MLCKTNCSLAMPPEVYCFFFIKNNFQSGPTIPRKRHLFSSFRSEKYIFWTIYFTRSKIRWAENTVKMTSFSKPEILRQLPNPVKTTNSNAFQKKNCSLGQQPALLFFFFFRNLIFNMDLKSCENDTFSPFRSEKYIFWTIYFTPSEIRWAENTVKMTSFSKPEILRQLPNPVKTTNLNAFQKKIAVWASSQHYCFFFFF